MALRNNKQMSVQRVKQDVAKNIRKSARTKYLPHVSAVGGYLYTSKQISILNDDTKDVLSNLGTNGVGAMQTGLATAMPTLSALLAAWLPLPA
jgi:outer membrane protein TolC